MDYQISLSDEAKRTLATLPGRYRQQTRRMIDALAAKPRPAEAKELRGRPGMYRLWLNGWRIIYQVDDEAGAALVIGIRRKTGPETYDSLDVN